MDTCPGTAACVPRCRGHPSGTPDRLEGPSAGANANDVRGPGHSKGWSVRSAPRVRGAGPLKRSTTVGSRPQSGDQTRRYRSNGQVEQPNELATFFPLWPVLATPPHRPVWSFLTIGAPRGSQKGAIAMQGIGMSAVTAYTAHREWATRPPDERYASVQALHEAARARRNRTMERDIETGEFRTDAARDDGLVLLRGHGSHRRTDALELRAARHHRRRAAEVPAFAARTDRVRRDQLRAAAPPSTATPAVRRP